MLGSYHRQILRHEQEVQVAKLLEETLKEIADSFGEQGEKVAEAISEIVEKVVQDTSNVVTPAIVVAFAAEGYVPEQAVEMHQPPQRRDNPISVIDTANPVPNPPEHLLTHFQAARLPGLREGADDEGPCVSDPAADPEGGV